MKESFVEKKKIAFFFGGYRFESRSKGLGFAELTRLGRIHKIKHYNYEWEAMAT